MLLEKKNQNIFDFFSLTPIRSKNQHSSPEKLHLLFDALSESIRVFVLAINMAERIKHRHTDRQTLVNYFF